MKLTVPFLIATMMLVALPAKAGDTPAPEEAYLYIGWPNNEEVIRTSGNAPFRVWFGLRHMGVAPAGIDVPNTGHHHLLVNTPVPPLDEPIPADETISTSGRDKPRPRSPYLEGSIRCS